MDDCKGMRVLQINSVCDFGSTGRTTRELADYLEEKGYECYVAYGHNTTSYHRAFRIGTVLENHLHNALFTRLLGLHGYGTRRGTKKLLNWIDEIKPDILHLRNLHANYLNFPMLMDYLIKHQIPVVLTLHDCFNYTGKCSHYTALNCYKWRKECRNCPTFRSCTAPSLIFDNSRKLFNQKKNYFKNLKHLSVVAVSKWLADQAKESPMFLSAQNIIHIYNWIDFKKFHRSSNEEVDAFYAKYNLSRNFKYLISVSQGWDNSASRYQDAIRLANRLPNNYRFIIVGSAVRGSRIEEPLIHIPYIGDTSELSAAYSMAEAYVHLSVEDTFGKVIAEAMACGTVPISFNSTACGEIPGPYGVVVPPHDVKAIIDALPFLEDMKIKREDMIRFVHENYDYHFNAHQYLELYQEILSMQS